MVNCFVPGCNSGYSTQRELFKKLGKRMPSMFSCKQIDVEKWNVAIRRADRKFSTTDRVCEFHFNVNDIERYFSHKLPDGSVHAFAREKPLLKPGCIPTIFPNYPDNLLKKSQKRISSVKHISVTTKVKVAFEKKTRAVPRTVRAYSAKDRVCKLHFNVNDAEQCFSHKFQKGSIQVLEGERSLLKRECIPTIFSNLPDTVSKKSQKRESPVEHTAMKITEEESSLAVISTTSENTEQQVTEFNLSDNIQLVKLPNQWWTIHSFPNYVACARWNDVFVLDRKVVIKNDNSIKVSLNDIDLQTDEKVSCIQDVSLLLQKVDDFTVCSNATNRFSFYLNLHDPDKHVL